MSVRVVLRTGKVLTYNRADTILVNAGTIVVEKSGPGTDGLYARFPLDIVERAEFNPPCSIRREPRLRDRRLESR